MQCCWGSEIGKSLRLSSHLHQLSLNYSRPPCWATPTSCFPHLHALRPRGCQKLSVSHANTPLPPVLCPRPRDGQKLSKMERYGSPTARPHFASSLRPADFEALVRSYLEFGLRGLEPKVGGWSWEELQALNERLDWEPWRAEARRRWGS